MEPVSEYQPPSQFSRTTGIPESTLAKKRMDGSGPPYVKIGRSVRYPVRAGLEWMAAQLRRSTSDAPSHEGRSRKRRRTTTVASAPGE
jgi:hypothetical protein